MRKIKNITSERVHPNLVCVKAGGFIFLTQIGINAKTGKIEEGIEAQAKRIFEDFKLVLEENGSSLENICKMTVYMTDLSKKAIFDKVYVQYFPNKKNRPVRACIKVGNVDLKLNQEVELEVQVIALA